MRINTELYLRLKAAIAARVATTGGPGCQVSWQDLVEAIKQDTTVKNWLVVRAVLQTEFIKAGILRRTQDLTVEVYEVLV